MRTVYVTLTVNAILTMDKGIDLSKLLDVEQLDIEKHEVTDSK